MLDLSAIDNETLLARGKYSTVRAALEDKKKELQTLCGESMSIMPKILKCGQSDDGRERFDATSQLDYFRMMPSRIQAVLEEIDQLTKMKQELKSKAW